MPDRNHHAPTDGWLEAFAALGQEDPPHGGWEAVAARLDARRAGRWRAGLAIAAVLALTAVLPWRLLAPGDAEPVPSPPATAAAPTAAETALAPLYAESARLEALLGQLRDGSVSSGAAAVIGGELEARLATVDMALARPGLDPEREQALWQQRIELLRELVDFEGTRLWLAANGNRYDPVLVQVD